MSRPEALALGTELTVAALLVLFVTLVSRQSDPALASDVVRPADHRVHHLGALSFEEARAEVERLTAARDGARDEAAKAAFGAQLSDLFVKRQMLPEAEREIDRAVTLAPTRVEILARAAVVHHALGDDDRARALLTRARQQAPQHPLVEQAATILRAPAREAVQSSSTPARTNSAQ